MSEASAGDELPHVVGPGLSWSESYWFELYDVPSGLGGVARLDVRPNEGAMDVALSFFLPDGGFITARHVAAQTGNTALLEAEGVRFAMTEPLRRWRVSYDGPGHSLGSVGDAGRREAWLKSRFERLIVELEFTALDAAPALPESAGVAGFDQVGRWTGEVWVSGDRYEIQAHGGRGKTWGLPAVPRLQRRFALDFGDGLALSAVETVLDEGRRVHGWIMRDGRTTDVRGIELATVTAPGSPIQKSFQLDLVDTGGRRHQIAGDVQHVAPLPGFRGGRDTLLCLGVATAVYDGKTGHGIAEYLHQLGADGNPLEPVT